MRKPGLLDNLISLRPGLSGTQYAGWTPRQIHRSGLGCRVFEDERIPVADGISLSATVSTPKPEGRYPAVLVFSAYSKELQPAGIPAGNNETGSPPVFTDRGYVHVAVTRRGMGRSQGESFQFFSEMDVSDHAKAIAWAAAQPWCDGNVVLFGTSYFGMVQAQVATLNPPALRGFFANEMCTDYFRHIGMFGGAPQTDFISLWMGANFTQAQFDLRMPPLARAFVSRLLNSSLRKLWWPQVRKRMTRIMYSFQKKTPVLGIRNEFAKMVFDAKTRATDAMGHGPSGRLGQIQVPFVVVQNSGYFNLHQFGSYDLFENAGTAKDRKWLIVGPAEYELPCLVWQLEALAFYDHLLFGVDNGYAQQPSVRYWTDGAEEFRSASDFPPPNGENVRYYLGSGGDDHAMHRLTKEGLQSGENRWAAVPMGAPVAAGIEEVANPILSYELPIAETTEFTGAVTLNLQFSCNEIDSQVVARLGRIDTAGQFHMLSIGTIRPATRRIDAARSTAVEIAIDIDEPQPLKRYEPVVLRFSLTPFPVELKTGEKLRLDIASRTDLLRSDQKHGRAQFDMQVPPYYSRNTIHYGPESYVELRELGRRARVADQLAPAA